MLRNDTFWDSMMFFFVLSLFFNVEKRHFLGFNDVFFFVLSFVLMLRNDTFWDSMMFFFVLSLFFNVKKRHFLGFY